MTTTATRRRIPAGRPKGRYVKVDAWRLRTTIALSGMTHSEIAARAHVSRSAISNLTSEARPTCRVETARAIAKALKQNPRDLFTVVIIDRDA